MKYRSKPVVIEAEQFLPFEHKDIGKILKEGLCYKAHEGFMGEVHCHTLEGSYTVRNTDWIIKGIKGEYYPVRADIFNEKYEELK